jgi:hypothetical protein
MKTSELQGAALDWAVEVALLSDRIKNVEQRAAIASRNRRVSEVGYVTDWSQGGPIIEREKISVGYERYGATGGETWDAVKKASHEDTTLSLEYGPTPLIAAMRCYCQSKLGDEVAIPEELR